MDLGWMVGDWGVELVGGGVDEWIEWVWLGWEWQMLWLYEQLLKFLYFEERMLGMLEVEDMGWWMMVLF